MADRIAYIRDYIETELRKVVRTTENASDIWKMIHKVDYDHGLHYRGFSQLVELLMFDGDILKEINNLTIDLYLEYVDGYRVLQLCSSSAVRTPQQEGEDLQQYHYNVVTLQETERGDLAIEGASKMPYMDNIPESFLAHRTQRKHCVSKDFINTMSRPQFYLGFPHAQEDVKNVVRAYQVKSTQTAMSYLEDFAEHWKTITPIIVQKDPDIRVADAIDKDIQSKHPRATKSAPIYCVQSESGLKDLLVGWPQTPPDSASREHVIVIMGMDIRMTRVDELLSLIRKYLIQPAEILILCEDNLDYIVS